MRDLGLPSSVETWIKVLPPLAALAGVVAYVYAPQAWGRRAVAGAVTIVATLVGVGAIAGVSAGALAVALAWAALSASLLLVRRAWGPWVALALAAALVGVAAWSMRAFATLPVLAAGLAGIAASVLTAAVAAARLKLRRRPTRA